MPQKADLQTKLKNNNQQINQLATQEELSAFRAAQKKRNDLEKQGRWTMISKAVKPRTTRVLPRGNWMDESGPIVLPSVPDFLGTIQSKKERLTRLDLANWLTDSLEEMEMVWNLTLED